MRTIRRLVAFGGAVGVALALGASSASAEEVNADAGANASASAMISADAVVPVNGSWASVGPGVGVSQVLVGGRSGEILYVIGTTRGSVGCPTEVIMDAELANLDAGAFCFADVGAIVAAVADADGAFVAAAGWAAAGAFCGVIPSAQLDPLTAHAVRAYCAAMAEDSHDAFVGAFCGAIPGPQLDPRTGQALAGYCAAIAQASHNAFAFVAPQLGPLSPLALAWVTLLASMTAPL